MRIIYCDSVFDPKQIEPDYVSEKDAAIQSGCSFSLISFEALVRNDVSSALKYVKEVPALETGIYRGWMLTPTQYEQLYSGLLDKNIQLVNSPIEYQHCHYLPDSYAKIKGKTPTSVWTTDTALENALSLIKSFGTSPLIVKDFVKSEKHHWNEACFIPDATNEESVQKIVEKFLELRGNQLNQGLVFRKFEPLQFLTDHSQSGMPLTKEFRIFFVRKQMIALAHYWDDVEYQGEIPDLSEFLDIAQKIESQFFTMDVAQKTSGEWIIMELGDGQVAGLPDNLNQLAFYRQLTEVV